SDVLPGLRKQGQAFTWDYTPGRLQDLSKEMFRMVGKREKWGELWHMVERYSYGPDADLDPLMDALARQRLYGERLPIEFFNMAQLAMTTLNRVYGNGPAQMDMDTAVDPVHARIMRHFVSDPLLIGLLLENFGDITDKKIAEDL